MGVAADPKLELLHHDLEVACEALGHDVDARAFRPHVTLGRVKRDASADAMRTIAGLARGVRYTGTVDVRSIDLMQSELSAAGPRYTVLDAIPLGLS
jgi:2'-5' RNA ligase